MLGRLARVAYLLALALMIAAYAISAANSPAPQPDHQVEYWWC
jgi:hypothetical protein